MDNIIKYEDKNYIFNYQNITYEINQISPLIELHRYKLIQKIKSECKDFFILNNINIDINSILPRWIMLQFKDSSYYIDPLLPYNGINNSQLKKDLHYLSNKKISLKYSDNIIDSLNLKEKFNSAINELREYIQSNHYINNYNNYLIDFELVDDFYNIFLKVNNEIFTYKLNKKIIDKILILYHKNTDLDDNLKKIILCIIIRYNTLESYNQQSAVLPELYEYLNKEYNVDCELFASSLNFSYSKYCSIYYDLESNIGSVGNFFTMDIKKGFYVANPPFDDTIMRDMSLKLVNSLKESNDELSIFITIPEWDKPEYNGFDCLDILKKSGYIQYIEKIKKNRVIFFNYYENKYKNLVNVYFILIQNKKGKKNHLIQQNLQKILLNFFPLKK